LIQVLYRRIDLPLVRQYDGRDTVKIACRMVLDKKVVCHFSIVLKSCLQMMAKEDLAQVIPMT
jgi:hypothetical protein